jgi:hypothetical protein
MLKEILEGLCNTLNGTLTKAHYRPANIDYGADNDVECAVKVMLGRQEQVGIGMPTKYDHYGWIYLDYGSNHQRAALKITEAIDEFLDWQAGNYNQGLGFDIGSGYYIRDMEHIPFQGYPKPKELFLQEMILLRFIWERR